MSDKKLNLKNAFTIKYGADKHKTLLDFIENNTEFHQNENASQFLLELIAKYEALKTEKPSIVPDTSALDEKIKQLEADNVKLKNNWMESNSELNELRNGKPSETTPSLKENELVLEFSSPNVCQYFRNEVLPAAVEFKLVRCGGDLFANFLNAFQSSGFVVDKAGFIPQSGTKVIDVK